MVPVCIILSTSSEHMILHDIYGHFLNETDSVSTLQLASLPEFEKCIRNLYYQDTISLWVLM